MSPYDPRAPIAKQVRQSFESSLEHLHTSVLDAYLLHGPSTRQGLARADLDAWEAMEALHAEGRARAIGVSNVTRSQLELLLDRATVKPTVVQNRCYASTGWDREVRALCRERCVAYQAFSLLTANRKEVASREVGAIAERMKLTSAQVVFRFAIDVGMTPLTGTADPAHMREDLGISSRLTEADLRIIESLSG